MGVIEEGGVKEGGAISGQPEQKKNREMDTRARVDRSVSGHAAARR